MKDTNNYSLEIKANQDGMQAEILVADALYKKKKDGYTIEIDGTDILGIPGEVMEFAVSNNNTVTISSGKKPQITAMTLEQGVCHYCMRQDDILPMSLGFSARTIRNNISEKGGTLDIDYFIKCNNLISSHVMMQLSLIDSSNKAKTGDTLNTDDYKK